MVVENNDAANLRSTTARTVMSPIPSKVVSRIRHPQELAHVPPAPGMGPAPKRGRRMRAANTIGMVARVMMPVMKRAMVFRVRERGNGAGEKQDRGGDDVSHGRIFSQLILTC